MKSLQKYPSLHYKQSLITDGRINLLDELLAPEVQQELKSLHSILASQPSQIYSVLHQAHQKLAQQFQRPET